MSEEQSVTKSNKKNLLKKWWFWAALIFVFIIIFILLIPKQPNPRLLDIASGEGVSISAVNLGIAQSAVDGTGEITSSDCLNLSNIAQRNGGEFYSDSVCEPGSSGFVAKRDDLAQTSEIVIYPRTGGDSILNCSAKIASFTFNKERTELISYSFKQDDCFQGVKLPISE